MTNPNNPYGPYINWTTYGGGNNPSESVKDASSQVKSAVNLGIIFTQLPGGRLAEMFGAMQKGDWHQHAVVHFAVCCIGEVQVYSLHL